MTRPIQPSLLTRSSAAKRRSDAGTALHALLESAALNEHGARIPLGEPRWITSSQVAHRILRAGISGSAVALLGLYIGIPKGEVANAIGLNRSTAYRKALKGETLPIHAADCALRLLDLAQQASVGLGGMNQARAWLRMRHPMLEGFAPLDCVSTSFGSQRAKELLWAVRCGLTR